MGKGPGHRPERPANDGGRSSRFHRRISFHRRGHGMFSLVALALAALGLYGVLAFFVARRVHEIGIRVALGASGGKVMGLVITRGMILVGVGSVLGIAGALGATRLVADMLFQTDATDIGTYAGVTGGFLILALAACVIPAWRALKVDPVVAFRSE